MRVLISRLSLSNGSPSVVLLLFYSESVKANLYKENVGGYFFNVTIFNLNWTRYILQSFHVFFRNVVKYKKINFLRSKIIAMAMAIYHGKENLKKGRFCKVCK